MVSQRCPLASASCSGVVVVSQGLGLMVSPLGSVTSFRPLRRLIWIGTDNVVKEKGWLFFIGKQDESDSTLFHVDDHRLVCCVVYEMIYQQWTANRSRERQTPAQPDRPSQ